MLIYGQPNETQEIIISEWEANRVNDVILSPEHAAWLIENGKGSPDMKVMSNMVDVSRAAVSPNAWNHDWWTGGRWPGDTDGITRSHLVIPYRFRSGYSNDQRAYDLVHHHMERISTEYMNGCIQYVDDTSTQAHSTYIDIRNDEGCNSWVGWLGKHQAGRTNAMSLSWKNQYNNCHDRYIIQHEFLHATGFNHEQTRPDRDEHIKVWYENINESDFWLYDKYPEPIWMNMSSPYDVRSVMHYGYWAGLTQEAGNAGLYAMSDIETGAPVQDPMVKRMSSEDAFQLQKMYPDFCPEPLPTRPCADGQLYLINFAW